MKYPVSIITGLMCMWVVCGHAVAVSMTGQIQALAGAGALIYESPVTGTVQLDQDLLTFNDFQFVYGTWQMQELELLPPGTYTRPDEKGVDTTVTIPPGAIGAYIKFNVMWILTGWSVSPDGTVFTPIDISGDGLPGVRRQSSPFKRYMFVIPFAADPLHTVSLTVQGGSTHECASHDGTSVTVDALAEYPVDDPINTIYWDVDGNSVGTGNSITEVLSLGSHIIHAMGVADSGITAEASSQVDVRDTQDPVITVHFLDTLGNLVTSTSSGQDVEVDISATDTCDLAPVPGQATATPTYGVNDGDLLRPMAPGNILNLPTSAVTVVAPVTDSSGNTANGVATLMIVE